MKGGFWARAAVSMGLFWAISQPALAAPPPEGGVNLTISPLPINLVAKPGTSVSADLKVKNNNPKPERLKATLYKFRAYGDEGKPLIEDLGPADDYKSWVTFSQDQFEAEPNVWKTVKMTINVPKTAAFGYYYAVAFSRADEVQPGKGINAISGATAILVLLEVESPNARRVLNLAEFNVDRTLYEFLPVSFKVKVRNDGNVHAVPHGVIFIKKGSKIVGQVSLNQARGNVLPQSNRIFSGSWTDGYPVYRDREEDGKAVLDQGGNTVRDLNYGSFDLRRLRFGKYTAQLVFAYDNGKSDIPLEASATFWVVPWRLLAGALLLLLVLGLGVRSVGRGIARAAGRYRR